MSNYTCNTDCLICCGCHNHSGSGSEDGDGSGDDSESCRSNITITNELFGYAGALGVSLILVPQVIKTYREKNVRGLSLTFLIINLWTGITFLIYGVLERIWPMIVSNIISLLCCFQLLFLYIKWNSRSVVDTTDRRWDDTNTKCSRVDCQEPLSPRRREVTSCQ